MKTHINDHFLARKAIKFIGMAGIVFFINTSNGQLLKSAGGPPPPGSTTTNVNENTILYHNNTSLTTTATTPVEGIGTAAPAATLDIEAQESLNPLTNAGHERILRCGINPFGTSCPDFFEIDNGTNLDNNFLPTLWGHRQSSNLATMFLMATTTSDNDNGTSPVMSFTSRLASGLFPSSDQLGSFSDVTTRPLFEWSGLSTVYMRMDHSGNVGLGLGSTFPTEQLHTKLGVRFEGLTADPSPTTVVTRDATGKLFTAPYSSGGTTLSCSTTNTVPKVTGSSALGCSQITDDGTNVGINHGSALTKLHITAAHGSGNQERLLRLNVDDANNDFVEFQNGTGTDNVYFPVLWGHKESTGYITPSLSVMGSSTSDNSSDPAVLQFEARKYTTSSSGNLPGSASSISSRPLFEWTNLNAQQMLMDANGNLGIGMTPGSYTVGTATGGTMGAPSGSVKLDVSGLVRCNTLAVMSDMRYKKNITDISDALSKITALQGVSYNWRKDEFKNKNFDDAKQLGFIAQDVEKIIPEAVIKDEKGYYGMNYIALIPVLTEAIKEQQKTIALQEEKISTIEKQLASNKGDRSLEMLNSIRLDQNIPNPFSEDTRINYFLPEQVSQATLIVFDMQGKEIKKINITQKGSNTILIHGSELKAGMYLYTLIADGKEIDTKRMILTSSN